MASAELYRAPEAGTSSGDISISSRLSTGNFQSEVWGALFTVKSLLRGPLFPCDVLRWLWYYSWARYIMSWFLLSDTISASFLYDLLFCKTINLSVSQFLSSWMWQHLLITEGCILKRWKLRENTKDALKSFELIPHFLSHLPSWGHRSK